MTNRVRVNLFSSDLGNASNGGVSARFKKFALYREHPSEEQVQEDLAAGVCPLLVVHRPNPDVYPPYARPVLDQGGIGPMYGGCIVHASDSRYKDVVGSFHPLKLHDRWESQALYNRLCN